MVAMHSKTVKDVSTSLSLNDGTNEICLLISNSEGLTRTDCDAAGRGEAAFTGVCIGVFPRDTREGERRARRSLVQAPALSAGCLVASQAQLLGPARADSGIVVCIIPFNRTANNGSFGKGLTGSMRAASSDSNSASAASKSSDEAVVALTQ